MDTLNCELSSSPFFSFFLFLSLLFSPFTSYFIFFSQNNGARQMHRTIDYSLPDHILTAQNKNSHSQGSGVDESLDNLG